MTVRVVIGMVAAFAAFAFMQRLLDRGVQIPGAIAGTSRMTDATAVDFEQQMKGEAVKFDVEVEAAAFGSTGRPDFLLVVANGSAIETTEELFASFTEGISQGGATLSGTERTGELDGATYRCIGAEGTAFRSEPACGAPTAMWASCSTSMVTSPAPNS